MEDISALQFWGAHIVRFSFILWDARAGRSRRHQGRLIPRATPHPGGTTSAVGTQNRDDPRASRLQLRQSPSAPGAGTVERPDPANISATSRTLMSDSELALART